MRRAVPFQRRLARVRRVVRVRVRRVAILVEQRRLARLQHDVPRRVLQREDAAQESDENGKSHKAEAHAPTRRGRRRRGAGGDDADALAAAPTR